MGGDDQSWSVEGFRRCKWHNNSRQPYGRAWTAGDILGCWLDAGDVSGGEQGAALGFTLNGRDLGDAFAATAAEAGRGLGGPPLAQAFAGECGGLCPAVSMAKDEQVELNFGQRPFQYRPPARVLTVAESTGGPPAPGRSRRGFRPVAALVPSSLMDRSACGGVTLSRAQLHEPVTSDELLDRLLALGLPCQWCVRATEGCASGLDQV